MVRRRAGIALEQAVMLAKAGGATLHIVHAFQNVSLSMAAMASGSGGPAVDLDRLNTGMHEYGETRVRRRRGRGACRGARRADPRRGQ